MGSNPVGFVKKHNFGVGYNRTCQGHALLHAARQLGRKQIRNIGTQTNGSQSLYGFLLAFALGIWSALINLKAIFSQTGRESKKCVVSTLRQTCSNAS